MTPTRAVVFDLYGTLTDPAVESGRGRLDVEMAALVGADPVRWTAAMRASFTARATGAWGSVPEILRRLCAEAGVSLAPAPLVRAVEMRLVHHRRLTEPRPEAARVIRALRDRGLRIAVLSDATPEIDLTWRAFALRELIDAAVFSCHVGARKPASVMYDTVTARLGTPAAECLYVGDGSSGELTGAERCGMSAIRIAADHGMHLDEDTAWSGTTIAGLDDLLPIVERR